MDRKIKRKNSDIPKHQQWLYDLADFGIVKAILFIWGVCVATIVIVFVILKWVIFNRH